MSLEFQHISVELLGEVSSLNSKRLRELHNLLSRLNNGIDVLIHLPERHCGINHLSSSQKTKRSQIKDMSFKQLHCVVGSSVLSDPIVHRGESFQWQCKVRDAMLGYSYWSVVNGSRTLSEGNKTPEQLQWLSHGWLSHYSSPAVVELVDQLLPALMMLTNQARLQLKRCQSSINTSLHSQYSKQLLAIFNNFLELKQMAQKSMWARLMAAAVHGTLSYDDIARDQVIKNKGAANLLKHTPTIRRFPLPRYSLDHVSFYFFHQWLWRHGSDRVRTLLKQCPWLQSHPQQPAVLISKYNNNFLVPKALQYALPRHVRFSSLFPGRALRMAFFQDAAWQFILADCNMGLSFSEQQWQQLDPQNFIKSPLLDQLKAKENAWRAASQAFKRKIDSIPKWRWRFLKITRVFLSHAGMLLNHYEQHIVEEHVNIAVRLTEEIQAAWALQKSSGVAMKRSAEANDAKHSPHESDLKARVDGLPTSRSAPGKLQANLVRLLSPNHPFVLQVIRFVRQLDQKVKTLKAKKLCSGKTYVRFLGVKTVLQNTYPNKTFLEVDVFDKLNKLIAGEAISEKSLQAILNHYRVHHLEDPEGESPFAKQFQQAFNQAWRCLYGFIKSSQKGRQFTLSRSLLDQHGKVLVCYARIIRKAGQKDQIQQLNHFVDKCIHAYVDMAQEIIRRCLGYDSLESLYLTDLVHTIRAFGSVHQQQQLDELVQAASDGMEALSDIYGAQQHAQFQKILPGVKLIDHRKKNQNTGQSNHATNAEARL